MIHLGDRRWPTLVAAFSLAVSLLVVVPSRSAGAVGVLPHDIVRISPAGDSSSWSRSNSAINADGTRIAFNTGESLDAREATQEQDVYVYDTVAGSTTLVSVASDGTPGNGWSRYPAINGDGTKIAFISVSSNFADDDTDDRDIFLHDTLTGITRPISALSGGTGGSSTNWVAISDDGTKVGFISESADLVADDNNLSADVFVFDTITATTTRVSVSDTGLESNGSSAFGSPSLNADGTRIAFASGATNLVAGDTNGQPDIFVRDTVAQTTTRVSVGPGGVESDHWSRNPSISWDGTRVAFSSDATNLAAGDAPYFADWDVFVHDTVTGATTGVSIDLAMEWSDYPSIDGSGNRVMFTSGYEPSWAAFVYDLTMASMVQVNVPHDRRGPLGRTDTHSPDISSDGSMVVFASVQSNLVLGDNNNVVDVFLTSSDCCWDTDGDGLDDDEEALLSTNRLISDTDSDGLSDGIEVNDLGTDPTDSDTDDDGLVDGDEQHIHLTDPLLPDSDGDGASDSDEVAAGTNPTAPVALFDPSSGTWHLRARDGSTTTFYYGIPGDVPLMGDWDCDGIDTVGMYRPTNGFAYLRNSNDFGVGEIEFFVGIPGDKPLAGDWDGDGCDSLGLFRGGQVLLANSLATGPA
ncbi:MAG: hypothetical protein ACR2OI_08260, partial [Acidimicrobiia bacterium]